MNADPLRPLPSEEQYRADLASTAQQWMPTPEEMERFRYRSMNVAPRPDMAQLPEAEPWRFDWIILPAWFRRIDWISTATWGAAFVLCLAFWAMVAWGILRRVF